MSNLPMAAPGTAPSAAPAPAATQRWAAIAATLRDEILDGRLAPGQRLPNETQLAQRFQVNRHTLRQAVQVLSREGHLSVRQGSGTYVPERVLDHALQRRTRLSTSLAEAGEQGRRELLGWQVQPAGPWAAALRVAAGQAVEVLRTRTLVRDRVVGLCTAAYPHPRLAGMAAALQREGGITRALASLGVADYTRARSVVATRLPTAAEAATLARSASQPVLVVDSVNVDAQGRPVEAACTLFAADAVQLTVGPEGWDTP